MATRTYSEVRGGRKGYATKRSHALCDGCGKEHPDSYQGAVTAPLPRTWTSSLQNSRSGGGGTLKYWCEECSKGGPANGH